VDLFNLAAATYLEMEDVEIFTKCVMLWGKYKTYKIHNNKDEKIYF